MTSAERSEGDRPRSRYVLITPARNEAEYIEHTLRAVTLQTLRPLRWVIVSDGSTDGTDEIVSRYAAEHDFIRLVRREPDATRNFASKVFAIREGEKLLADLDYEFIGNLDADVSFEADYYERVLKRFESDPRIGVGSGRLFEEVSGKLKRRLVDPHFSVPGPIQLFRRACYEEIGGYMPLRYGGVDAMAEASARMHGWKTRTFMDIEAVHHRVTGTAVRRSLLHAAYRDGVQEYVNGYHPLFELGKTFRRMFVRPYVLGGLARLIGYVGAGLRRLPRSVPEDLVRHLHKEQLGRVRHILSADRRRLALEEADSE